jgi:putative membrane protein
MWVAMVLFIALIALGVFAVLRASGWGRPAAESPEPMKILKERLARGEIDAEEYERRRDLIQSDR